MSEPVLRTHTERCRDQRRIETLEAELGRANQQNEVLASAYTDALEALADAREWRAQATMYAIAAGLAAVLLLAVAGMSTQLEAQALEARVLLADLAAIGTELDEEGVTLVVEGETSLAQAVASALVEAHAAEAAAAATAELIAELALRHRRQTARAERIRDRVAMALSSLGLRKLVTAAGVVSLTAAPPRVIVTDESTIPDQWWKEKITRSLDKAGIRAALQEGRTVEGACLSNRQETIRVRV